MILPLPSLQPEPSFDPPTCLAVLTLWPPGPRMCPTFLVTSGPPLLSALQPHCSLAPPGTCQPPGLCPWTPSPPRVPGDVGGGAQKPPPHQVSAGRVGVGTGPFSSSLGAALTWGALLRSPPPGRAAALAWIGVASDSGVTLAAPLLPVGCTE